jgi:hypothetical protein
MQEMFIHCTAYYSHNECTTTLTKLPLARAECSNVLQQYSDQSPVPTFCHIQIQFHVQNGMASYNVDVSLVGVNKKPDRSTHHVPLVH